MISLFPVHECGPVSRRSDSDNLDAEQADQLIALRRELESKLRRWRGSVPEHRASPLEPTAQASVECRPKVERRYTTEGPLRGPCGHKHHHLEAVLDCLDGDEAICVTRGGHTDRQIYVVEGASRRTLTPVEQSAVAEYRRQRTLRGA